MKFNAGIITSKLQETKEFYIKVLGLNVIFENDFYLLMGSENGDQISFLLPDHPTQKPLFQSAFAGKGVYLTVEVSDVDKKYQQIKAMGIEVAIGLRSEDWGDRHFAIIDPNGIGVDIVTYTPPED